MNLRGMREAGLIFMLPTAVFVGTHLIMVGIGPCAVYHASGHPQPVIAPLRERSVVQVAGVWLLLRAFASGAGLRGELRRSARACRHFREPVVASAQRSLGAIIAILLILLGGIAIVQTPRHRYLNGIGCRVSPADTTGAHRSQTLIDAIVWDRTHRAEAAPRSH